MDWEANYMKLKVLLDQALRDARNQTDFRTAKEILIKAQAAFRDFRLKPEAREELNRELQEAFSVVNRKMEEERLRFELESQHHYLELKMKLEEAVKLAANEFDWREARKYLIDVQQEFKGIRMIPEQRETLYTRLQQAFDEVKIRQDSEHLSFLQASEDHYRELAPMVDKALIRAGSDDDFASVREFLISVQASFRGIRMEKEKREMLYSRLQQAFDTLNGRMDREREKNREVAGKNYEYFRQQTDEILKEAGTVTHFKEVRDRIRDMQSRLKDSILLREQKDELYAALQEAFTEINRRQDSERSQFEQEGTENYKRLGKLVADGLQQAQESMEFRETREFLKRIQAGFKGIRMHKDHREELYSRLQSAFTILRERTDQYFREKQKNWEVKMEFRLRDLNVRVLELQVEISREKERLEALQDQLDILDQKPSDHPARLMVVAQIQSVTDSIRKKEELIDAAAGEIEDLQGRLESE